MSTPTAIKAVAPPGFTYDPRTGAYFHPDGRAVTPAELRAALQAIVDDTQGRLLAVTQRYLDGRSDLLGFRTAFQAVLREGHLMAGALGQGGTEQMDRAARGFLGSRLRAQYDALSGFALDLAQGKVSPAQALARTAMYGSSPWTTFMAVGKRLAGRRGYDEERSVLDPGAAHCDECISVADDGWSPLGSLPLPGERTCLANCACSIDYRNSAEEGGEGE